MISLTIVGSLLNFLSTAIHSLIISLHLSLNQYLIPLIGIRFWRRHSFGASMKSSAVSMPLWVRLSLHIFSNFSHSLLLSLHVPSYTHQIKSSYTWLSQLLTRFQMLDWCVLMFFVEFIIRNKYFCIFFLFLFVFLNPQMTLYLLNYPLRMKDLYNCFIISSSLSLFTLRDI